MSVRDMIANLPPEVLDRFINDVMPIIGDYDDLTTSGVKLKENLLKGKTRSKISQIQRNRRESLIYIVSTRLRSLLDTHFPDCRNTIHDDDIKQYVAIWLWGT